LESVNTSKQICIDRAAKDISKSKIFPWINQSSAPGIIQISEGCNMVCTYCCTQISRGKAISFPLEDILGQIQYYIDRGTKEIYLTGQDCGFYRWESLQIVDLVREIEKKYGNEEIFIRIGMIDPIRPEEIIELTRILQSSQIFYKFLHLPIQSASDNVLRLMKRGYTKKTLEYLFQSIQKYEITISTDIICGFPHESEEDFLHTYDFIQKFQPDIINISKFTPRPNTEAKKMPQLDSTVIKHRTLLLTNLHNEYLKKSNLRWIGWKGKALIHGFQPTKPMKFSCRNKYYKSIVLDRGVINKFVSVEIIDSSGQFLTGKIINH
jgi:MiaB/RimO family radical SAM methylthiotransferase